MLLKKVLNMDNFFPREITLGKNTSSNKTSKLVLSNLLICFFISEEANITLPFA